MSANDKQKDENRFSQLAHSSITGQMSDAECAELDSFMADPGFRKQYIDLCLKSSFVAKVFSRLGENPEPSVAPAFHAYFVVDLAGDPKMIANLQKAFEGLGDTLNTADVYQFGKFSLVTYNGDAQIAVPSCKPRMFQVPDLVPHAGDTRSLGSAYQLLTEQRQREVKPDDYGAMVFTLLNGPPSDDWEQPANRVKELFGQNSIMIDQSGEVDAKLLNKATEYSEVFGIKGTEQKDYQNLIKEIGSCVEQTSTQYSKIGHSIQAEHQGTSAPLGPTLSLSWDILTSLAS